MGSLRAVRQPPPRQARLRVVPSSCWAIRQLALSLPVLIQQWPELREVRVDLRLVTAIDDMGIAALKQVIALGSTAGVGVAVEACSPDTAASLLAGGVTV